MPSWTQGADTLDSMVAEGSLRRADVGADDARRMLEQAREHLHAAEPHQGGPVSCTLLYEACRQALSALLAAQGLCATDAGGDMACYEAAMARFEPPYGQQWRTFNRLRSLRSAGPDDRDLDDRGQDELDNAADLLAVASRLVDELAGH